MSTFQKWMEVSSLKLSVCRSFICSSQAKTAERVCGRTTRQRSERFLCETRNLSDSIKLNITGMFFVAQQRKYIYKPIEKMYSEHVEVSIMIMPFLIMTAPIFINLLHCQKKSRRKVVSKVFKVQFPKCQAEKSFIL